MQNLEGDERCEEKEDRTISGKISFTLLLLYTIYLLKKNVQNLLYLKEQRKKRNVHKLLVINIAIFIFLLANAAFFIDGPITFFTPKGVLSFNLFQILELLGAASLQVVFAIGYYNWSSLFATVYEKPKKLVNRLVFSLAFLHFLIFSVAFILFAIVIAMNGYNPCDASKSNEDYTILLNVQSIAILTNTSLFTVACNLLINKLKAIYNFSSERSANRMRKMLIFTVIASLLRIALDVTLENLEAFKHLRTRILLNHSNTQDEILWAIYNLGFFIICNLIPTDVLLLNFSPIVTKVNDTTTSHGSHGSPSANCGSTEGLNAPLCQRKVSDTNVIID